MPDDMTRPVEQDAAPGAARCPGPLWDDFMAADSRPVPDFLLGEHYEYMGSEPLSTERYTSPEFFQRELEKMWPNVWQFAAREEELPDPGDYVLYENAGRSYLVTRQPDGSVKAFHNVCLHRGRKLRTDSGWAEDFKCPFHGFAWRTDGSLQNIPCRWDFPHLNEQNMQLPEASVGQWGGYIFVRDADTGPTLEEYLAPYPADFARWKPEETYTAIWVAKKVKANWKATAEAFMEAWHSIETHPQILPYTGDANTKYNVYQDHTNVALTPFAVMSPHIDPEGKSQQWIVDEYIRRTGRGVSSDARAIVREGQNARAAMADTNRKIYGEMFGRDYTAVSDSEMVDAFTYNVFPNFSPWGGMIPNIVYRWRPWPDHENTLMEVRVLFRCKPGEKAPRAVPMHMLGDDEPWTAAAELGGLGEIFQQDMMNLPYVQEGMKVSKTKTLELGNYQDIRVRHFHRTLDKYLARE